MTRLAKAGLVVGALLVMTASAAWATGLTSFGFVGSDGSVTACVHNSDGTIRLLDPSSPKKDLTSCRSDETKLSFDTNSSAPRQANVTVDCTSGAHTGVQQALDQNAGATSLVVTIRGTCTESVSSSRPGVTLQASSPGDGIDATAEDGPALLVGGGSATLIGLTLTGDNGALAASAGSVQVRGGHLIGAVGDSGNASMGLEHVAIDCQDNVHVDLGATLFVAAGSITGCGLQVDAGSARLVDGVLISGARIGVAARGDGFVEIDGATISNDGYIGVEASGGTVTVNTQTTVVSGYQIGVQADNGGTASVINGAQISGNTVGVEANLGGHLSIGRDTDGPGAMIESNTADGIRVIGASTLQIGGDAVVQDNGGNGITLSDTSVAELNGVTVTRNGGVGLHCDGPPSVAVERGPTDGVTGNTGGNVDCQNAGQPG